MDSITLYNDDCLNVLPTLKDKSINLFILDLPYSNSKFGKCSACNWDLPIDLNKMWEQIKRIMKPDAVIVFICNVKLGYALIDSNLKMFSYDLVWEKSKKVGFLSAKKQPLRHHELIYIFKKKQGTYNPQMTEGKEYNKFRPTQNVTTKHGVYGKIFKENKEQKVTTRYPTSILPFKNVTNNILIHPTQKPIELLEWIVKTYSNESDTIKDFTMGSGTCGVACINTKRKFIGVEMDKEMFELASNRILT